MESYTFATANLPDTQASPRLTWAAWLVGVAGCAALIIGTTHLSEERELLSLLEEAHPWWLLAAAGLQAGTYGMQGMVWRAVAAAGAPGKAPLPLSQALRLSLAVLFVNQALPSAGVSGIAITRAGLQRVGLPPPTVAAVVLVDVGMRYATYGLCLGVAVLLALVSGAVPGWILLFATIFMLITAAVGVFMIALPTDHLDWLERFVLRFERSARVVHWLLMAERDLCARPALLIRAGLLHTAIFLMDAGTLWCGAQALGAAVAPQAVFVAFMISTLFRTLGFMPGGLGTFEAASVWMLRLMGMPWAAGLSTTLLFRGLSFWLPMLPGFFFSRHLAFKRTGQTPSRPAAPDA